MKQYEIRPCNGTGTYMEFKANRREDAIAFYLSSYANASINSERYGSILVLHEWETPEEEDKARLDWLELNRESNFDFDSWTNIFNGRVPVRRSIDICRKAPQPTITVIATPDGVVEKGNG